MSARRIAIACQGGGSQCAFIAGVLDALFAEDIQHRFKIVGLSGTSGGALTATLAWAGLLEQAQGGDRPIQDRILACWKDLTAQTPREIALDKMCVDHVRMVEQGRIPNWVTSPSSRQFQAWAQAAAAMIGRPEFTDLRVLMLKHVDFGALTELVRPDSPALLIGAADVLEGTFKVFSSVNHEISVDAVLASAAIPTLFPAVWVDGHAYWDGIFSSNPPVSGFVRKQYMGTSPRPEEIWIIQVNPSKYTFVPEAPSDVFDRRNHLAGNISLQHELEFIELINILLREHALPDELRARFSLDVTEPVVVRFIRMSEDLQKDLDYPSKLSRAPSHIAALIAHGQQRAKSFLAELGAQPPFEAAPGELRMH